MKGIRIYLMFGFAIAFVVGLGVTMWQDKANSPLMPKLGGDFALTSAAGPVRLEDFRGKLVLVYFGYTHCPDVCPVSLANIKVALKQLPPEQAAQVQTIFVSVDPERDSPEHLAAYTQFFDKSFIGVTGNKAEIDAVVQQYGAFYRMVPTPDSAMGYTVDHSSRIYLIDVQGKLQKFINHDAQPSAIAEVLKANLNVL